MRPIVKHTEEGSTGCLPEDREQDRQAFLGALKSSQRRLFATTGFSRAAESGQTRGWIDVGEKSPERDRRRARALRLVGAISMSPITHAGPRQAAAKARSGYG